jgi:mono/diheme cytochrome c family protein
MRRWMLPALLLLGGNTVWAQGDPLIMRGKQIYAEKKCAVCHMIKGKGGKTGGDLSDVGAKRDEQWLRAFIKDPKSMNPKSKMIIFKGSDQELDSLVAYMASLK